MWGSPKVEAQGLCATCVLSSQSNACGALLVCAFSSGEKAERATEPDRGKKSVPVPVPRLWTLMLIETRR